MDANLINPFISSTVNVLSTMCSVKLDIGKPSVKQGKKTWGDVTGIIGLAGESVMGNMMISFEKSAIIHLVSKMLMEEFAEMNQEVVDAVGEITNMVIGGAKTGLSELGMSIDMALPMVVTGKGVEINQLAASPVITVPFSFSAGSFVLEANLMKR